ncbi:MAG TPA: DUF4129 domain-containing protein [Streptosporangiaceae bacterium]|nr:DUF4129 domain-containing protein [Streptosporangiaceae bacterium]
MSQQRSTAGGRRGDARGSSWARVALAAALIAVVAVGLRDDTRPPALDGPFRHDGLLVGAILEAVLACLLVALAVRRSRAPRGALLAARLRWLLTYVVGIGLVTIPAAYLLSRHVHLRSPRLHPATSTTGLPRVGHAAGGGNIAGWLIVAIIGVLVTAALIYALARIIPLGRGFWAGWRWRAALADVEAAAWDDESQLLEAVESGQSALRRLDDARTAIIACYVAMEESLARAGTARAVADTPDELLARAADRGLVTGGAAAWLTALFYEARFSSHPMPPTARGAAELALSELAESLGDPMARSGGPRRAGSTEGRAGTS